jgi:predicted nuclease of predicted toxin-antitoxin system
MKRSARSGGSRSSAGKGKKKPERPTFYVDRCLGKAVPRELQAAGALVEIHDDHFAQDAPDEEWIPQVSARGWVILTKDKNIRRRHGERETVLLASARIFTLSSGNMKAAEMARLFVGNLTEMESLAVSCPPPFVAVVSLGGIQLVLSRPASPPGTEGEGTTEPSQ